MVMISVRSMVSDGGSMDLSKVIVAREKSVAKLNAEIVELERQVSQCKSSGNFPGAVSLGGLISVRKQRRDKLMEEIQGLKSVSTPQLELPSTSSSEAAPAPGPVAGRGRR